MRAVLGPEHDAALAEEGSPLHGKLLVLHSRLLFEAFQQAVCMGQLIAETVTQMPLTTTMPLQQLVHYSSQGSVNF